MAVVIKKPGLTLLSLAERLFSMNTGVVAQAAFLHHEGCMLELTPTRIQIVADTGKDMAVIASVSLKMAALNLALANKVGSSVSAVIRAKVRNLIEQAHTKYIPTFEVKIPEPKSNEAELKAQILDIVFQGDGTPHKVAAIKQYREVVNCSLKEAKDQVEAWMQEHEISKKADDLTISADTGTVTVTSMQIKANLDAAPCQLEDATMLHQPVYGTGVNSRYHVVAISPDCVVAARIKKTNYKTGIRVLPKNNVMPKSKLLAAGLKETDGPHFSVHLDAGTIDMAQRSIGSTLFSLGHDFKHVSSDLALLVGAGK